LDKEEVATFDEISKNFLEGFDEGDYAELEKHLSSPFKKMIVQRESEEGVNILETNVELFQDKIGNVKEVKFIDILKMRSTRKIVTCAYVSDSKEFVQVYYPLELGVSKYVMTIHEITNESDNESYFFTGLIEEDAGWKVAYFQFQGKSYGIQPRM